MWFKVRTIKISYHDILCLVSEVSLCATLLGCLLADNGIDMSYGVGGHWLTTSLGELGSLIFLVSFPVTIISIPLVFVSQSIKWMLTKYQKQIVSS